MRILVVSKVDLSRQNAESVHLLALANHLGKLGHRICLIAPRPGEVDVPERVDIVYVPLPAFLARSRLRSLVFQVLMLPQMVRIMRTFRPHVTYVRQGPFLLVPACLSRLLNRPVVSEVNGFFQEELIFLFSPPQCVIRLSGLVERVCYRISSAVVVVTREIGQKLEGRFMVRSEKCVVVGNGVDLEMFHPLDVVEARHRLGIDVQGPVIGMVASLLPWHGVDRLIEASAILSRSWSELRVVVVGGGERWAEVERLLREQSMEGQVMVTGEVDHARVPGYVNACDVCLVLMQRLSSKEGSPLKLHEYLACGRPVVASNRPAFQFLEEEKVGVLVNPENPEEIAAAVSRLLSSPTERREMGERARRLAEHRLGWDRTAEQVARVCGEVVGWHG
jgi:glycosyltransferase involved in cell wall biosynthesis